MIYSWFLHVNKNDPEHYIYYCSPITINGKSWNDFKYYSAAGLYRKSKVLKVFKRVPGWNYEEYFRKIKK